MVLDDPTNKPDRWAPKLDSASSIEHRECIKLAYKLCGRAEKQFPDFFSDLKSIPSVESLKNERPEKPLAHVIGFSRRSEKYDLGLVNGFEYTLTIERYDRVGRSQKSDSDEVGIGIVEIAISPKSVDEDLANPLTHISISISRHTDNVKTDDPLIVALVPTGSKGRAIENDPFSESITDDDEEVPRHVLTLDQIALSDNPELGNYALFGIKQVLEKANEYLVAKTLRQ